MKNTKKTNKPPIEHRVPLPENPLEHNEPSELDIAAVKADFGVNIEEVMSRECSSYECILTDERDLGVLWSFVIEDSISGFIGVEDNENGLGIETVTTGIHLKEISGIDRDELMHLLELNSELINATFTVAHIVEKPGQEPEEVFAEEGESIEYNDEEEAVPTSRDILVIQCRIPLSVFDADDFPNIVQNLIIQSDIALNVDPETGERKESEF